MVGGGFVDWPSDAVGLVERAVEAHGGYVRHREIQSISFVVDSFGGPLPWMKGIRIVPTSIEVFPHDGKTVFHDYPAAEQFGVFHNGNVALYSQDAPNTALEQSPRHRDTFRGIGKYRRWSPLDALYFFGYAWINYMSLPFLLRDCAFVESCTWRKDGRMLRGVTVDFPDGFDTHGKRQRFFFGDDGRLVRHDYTADVVGSWANGAHFSNDYAVINGIPFATRRHVLATLRGRPTPIPVLHATLSRFSVRFRGK